MVAYFLSFTFGELGVHHVRVVGLGATGGAPAPPPHPAAPASAWAWA